MNEVQEAFLEQKERNPAKGVFYYVLDGKPYFFISLSENSKFSEDHKLNTELLVSSYDFMKIENFIPHFKCKSL